MKRRRFATSWIATAVFTLYLMGVFFGCFHAAEAFAAWPTTTDTRCWTTHSTEPEELLLKLRIIPVGEGNFLLSGIALQKNGRIHNVVSGSAYRQGRSVHMVVTDVGKSSTAMWANTFYVVLNATTLRGRWESIGHDKNYADGSLDTEYDSGTFMPVDCP